MKSGWFWNTPMWAAYQAAYHLTRPESESYKSSPLADDHDFGWDAKRENYKLAVHETQVIDLTPPLSELWPEVRGSYHSLIHGAQDHYLIEEGSNRHAWYCYKQLHIRANKCQPRSDETYDYQWQWMQKGHGLLVAAYDLDYQWMGAAYWIIYDSGACYMSGPSIKKNVQHGVIWRSLEILKAMGIRLAELGQIDGETEKERGISTFKRGFGGQAVPFTVATRRIG